MLWLVAGMVLKAEAGPQSEALNRDTLLSSDSLQRWSITLDYKLMQRDVKPDFAPVVELRANTISGSLGYDPFRWLTIYAGAGTSEGKFQDIERYRSSRFSWATGLHAYLWNWESDREHKHGLRLFLDLDAEYARSESGSGDDVLTWSEISAALPLKIELVPQHYNEIPIDFYSMLFYAAPAVSMIDGTRSLSGRDVDFTEDRSVGFYAGAELYVFKSFSLGARMEYFDTATLKATARYHF
ncbi:MAG: hypothetical protein V2A34_03070 [Lentisphaerota bacterium]